MLVKKVTAEILLIRTNIARINVAWKNVPSKFGQNRVSNSWDIADMEKCFQDICDKIQMGPIVDKLGVEQGGVNFDKIYKLWIFTI